MNKKGNVTDSPVLNTVEAGDLYNQKVFFINIALVYSQLLFKSYQISYQDFYIHEIGIPGNQMVAVPDIFQGAIFLRPISSMYCNRHAQDNS